MAMLQQIRQVCAQHKSQEAAIRALGLKEHTLKEAIAEWLGNYDDGLAFAANEVVKGKPQTALAKLLAVEREFAIKQLGRGKRITLYRGVGGDYSLSIKKMTENNDKVNIWFREAHSWTDNPNVAAYFGNVVLKMSIPTCYIISCHLSNDMISKMHEYEYIVSFPRTSVVLKSKQIQIK